MVGRKLYEIHNQKHDEAMHTRYSSTSTIRATEINCVNAGVATAFLRWNLRGAEPKQF